MNSMDQEKFEKVREFVFGHLNTDLVMVYRHKDPSAGNELKWCRAYSAKDWRTQQDYDRAAAHYYSIAKSCFDERKNFLTDESPGAPNEAGQRWWVLILGGGPLRDAGYVLVVRVAIKDPKELESAVRQVYNIFGSGTEGAEYAPVIFR